MNYLVVVGGSEGSEVVAPSLFVKCPASFAACTFLDFLEGSGDVKSGRVSGLEGPEGLDKGSFPK